MKKPAIIAVIALFLIIVAVAIFYADFYFNVKKYDFTAQSVSDSGEIYEATMSDFKGEYKLLYFGFGFCPDVCPTSLALTAQILGDLNATNARVLFATLDLKRDDAKSCDEYAKYFYPKSSCLRLNDLDAVVKNYGAKYKIIPLKDSAIEYSVAHSSSLFLFDKDGRFVENVTNLTYENTRKRIENLLKNH